MGIQKTSQTKGKDLGATLLDQSNMTNKPSFTDTELMLVKRALKDCIVRDGKNQPMKAAEIADATNLHDMTLTNWKVRSIIRRLIRGGIPIVSSSDGYWIANSVNEIERDINSLRGRMVKIEARTLDLERCKFEMMGEQS